ncbi:Regulatory protein NPR1 [Raphanus sativus]|uniref:Regulatory protein NPR1-like isoform X1 n=1 Tax=Raphanus sativus TaxID=3726 RepID=A0A9W3CD86_RAPSA|nr:regulatory protein NPR1-like isoform X1 [Raphanus sativus]KAJ4877169.1 Regulatory protein NPR1 [Raphanus sativus]
MDSIAAGFGNSYEISSTCFFASSPTTDNTDSSILDVSALRLLSNSLESVFDSPESFYSDAKLVLSCGREVPFHRVLLAARSPFFRNALTTNAVVKLELKEIAKDHVVGVDSVIAVLAYIYTGRVKPPPRGVSECADENCRHVSCRPAVDFMVEVLYLASVFEVYELVTLYQRHLLDVIDKVVIEEDTLLLILKLSSICGEACKKLTDRCVEVIVNSDVDLVTLDKSLPQHIVKEIVNLRNDLGIEVPGVGKHVLNIYKALDSDDVELVEMLLSEGHTNLDDAYALHFAVKYCDVKTANDLLDLEIADVNLRNPRGYTVLYVAAMRKEPDLIVSLLTKGSRASETSLEGRTALLIAKQVTMAAEYSYLAEQCKPSLKGRLCVEILEQANKGDRFPGDAVSPSLAMADHELKMRLLYLENRVALAQRLFPTEAQVAMNIAQTKGTSEFTGSSLDPDHLAGAKRTSPDLKTAPFKILEEHQRRLKALSKTVELGKRFFPQCSAVLDQIMDCDDLNQLACGEGDTPQKRLQKKQRYMEIQEIVKKAFIEDKEELVNSSLSPSSSSTSKSIAGKRSKLYHRRR